MNNIDTNIKNYNIIDLYDILGINHNVIDIKIISNKADVLISTLNKQKKYKLAKFIGEVKSTLLTHLNSTGINAFNQQASSQLLNNFSNQYTSQNNTTQNNKVTQRKNTTTTFNNNHQVMNRQMLGVNQTHTIPVLQGNINPNLKNITTRTICIDSQYRNNIYPYSFYDIYSPSFNTNFTVELSEPINNVLSISLYSVQIPKTWYNVDSFIGNNCFEIIDNSNNMYSYTLTPGNYTPSEIELDVNNITNIYPDLSGLLFTYISKQNKFSISNNTGKKIYIYFYKKNGFSDNVNCSVCNNNSFQNNNLGWNIGFRNTPDISGNIVLVLDNSNTIISHANVDLYGTKYCMIILDDFNKNRLNKGLINTSQQVHITKLPNYTSNDNLDCVNNETVYQRLPQRKLTQAQLFTINSIKNSIKPNKNRFYAPNNNDVIGLIPINNNNNNNQIIVNFGNDLLHNNRDYFGPVNIDKFHVKLVDDKGRLMNLNGCDWSFSLHIKQLYQY